MNNDAHRKKYTDGRRRLKDFALIQVRRKHAAQVDSCRKNTENERRKKGRNTVMN